MARSLTAARSKKQEITRILRERLDSQIYPAGEFLPPERKLALDFGVTRPTLRRAMEPLVQEGRLSHQAGLGTRVTLAGQRDDARPSRNGWKILGLVLPDIANRFFMEVTEAIEYTALQRGYQLLLCNSRHSPAVEEIHLRQLAEARVDGVILGHDPNLEFPAAVRRLEEASIPTVCLFTAPAGTPFDSVTVDEAAGVEQVMRYLFSLGHRGVAFFRPVPGATPHPRERAYRQILERSGGTVDDDLVIPYESSDDSVCAATLERLLARPTRPTALFTGNDRVALVVLKHLSALGVRVPQDVSVIGFDNMRFTEHLPVPLTTVDQPKLEMGRRAAELLLERIEIGVAGPPRAETYEPRLIIRDSCAIAPAEDALFVLPALATR